MEHAATTPTYSVKSDQRAFTRDIGRSCQLSLKFQRGPDTTQFTFRREFVCAHSIALAELARLGRTLFSNFSKTWPAKLKKFRPLNWRRTNTDTWEGRAMLAGRLSKAGTGVVLTGNALKHQLSINLSDYETEIEESFNTRAK